MISDEIKLKKEQNFAINFFRISKCLLNENSQKELKFVKIRGSFSRENSQKFKKKKDKQ